MGDGLGTDIYGVHDTATTNTMLADSWMDGQIV